MGLFSSKKKNVKYLLCVRDVFTKYAWVKLLKKKAVKQFLMLPLQQKMNLIVNQINYGLIKEENFYNKLMREWLENNDILLYSTHNEVKSLIAEKFMKSLKSKIYKKNDS